MRYRRTQAAVICRSPCPRNTRNVLELALVSSTFLPLMLLGLLRCLLSLLLRCHQVFSYTPPCTWATATSSFRHRNLLLRFCSFQICSERDSPRSSSHLKVTEPDDLLV